MYEILVNRSAKRDLEKLPALIHDRIIEKIMALAPNPTPAGSKKLKGTGPNDWRIREGDYRVVYAIDEEKLEIEIMRVGHRREIYR